MSKAELRERVIEARKPRRRIPHSSFLIPRLGGLLATLVLLALAGCGAAPTSVPQQTPPLPTPFPTQPGEQALRPPPVPTQPRGAGEDAGDPLPAPMGTSVVSAPEDDSLPPPVGTVVLEEP